MKSNPAISNVMTPDPQTIGKTLPLQSALQLMNKHHIPHLPVLDRGSLVGLLSDQDLRELPWTTPESLHRMKVEDLMMSEPLMVEPETPLMDVADEMARHNHPCAVVCHKNGKVLGIFTAADALRVLKETLSPPKRAARAPASSKHR
jgi:acetoin utilization protein AcuB